MGLLINYNMARGLPGRSCLKSFNIIKKTTSSLTPTLKKLIKFQKFIFSFVTIFFKKNSYLILRSGKFGNLVTSFFFVNKPGLCIFFFQKLTFFVTRYFNFSLYIQGLPYLNVGTSHSYRGPQMEQTLPLPLFLFRP